MSSSPHIVPPKPTELRFLRRRKAWFFGWSTFALAGLSLLLLVTQFSGDATISPSWMFVCAGLTGISGIFALVFRFTEQPRQVIVRRFPRWPGEPPVIHLRR